MATPISDDEAAGLFEPLQGSRVLVALSGGADSVCLLWLLSRWKGAELIAATVDHGLRTESREEASRAGEFARSLGIAHAILPWVGEKPFSGIEAKARNARYELLDQHAWASDARFLATAHTLDDQAETVLMRLAAGSGPSGLSGMRPVVERSGTAPLCHVRPFLDVTKDRLIATLQAQNIGWCEDPMNTDANFARVRLRQSREVLAGEGLTSARLATLAKRMARAEKALGTAANDAWLSCVTCDAEAIIIGTAALELPEEIFLRLLRRAIGGDTPGHSPRYERVEALAESLVAASRGGKSIARTLGGKRVALTRRGIVITAEPSRRLD